jgi:hypothetical protein
MLKFSKVSIEPYFDPEVPNMGLEKYGLSMFADTEVQEYLSKDQTGRYLTGLDPDSSKILYIEDDDVKTYKIDQINETISRLERIYGKGTLDARNDGFWSNFNLTIKNCKKDLDLSKPQDEITYHCIKAGGFTEVAKDYDTAKNSSKIYKFYLKKEDEETESKIKSTILINEAKGKLNSIYHEDPSLQFRIAKVVLPAGKNYKPITSPGLIYQELNDYIEGKTVKSGKRDTAAKFLKAVDTDRETLSITGVVNDAMYYNIITQEKNGHFYNKETDVRLGKNIKEIVEFLKSPINSSELENLTQRVEAKWRN